MGKTSELKKVNCDEFITFLLVCRLDDDDLGALE